MPPNTTIIIDRNTHYLKTKSHGFYIFLPWCDKITTVISKNPMYRNLVEYYEAEDGNIYFVKLGCVYQVSDINKTLKLLSTLRRSIDDILKSSVYFAMASLKSFDISEYLENKVKENLIKELASVNITLRKYSLSSFISSNQNVPVFKPHISRGYNDDLISNSSSNNNDSPIQMY